MRIGVDVGGTNTDAVLLRGRDVVAAVKRPTTAEVGEGVEAAIAAVLDKAGADVAHIHGVMIGTTHFTNAFIQGRDLARVGIIRIGFPAAQGVPPMADWPERLRERVEGPIFMLRGGHQFDGREIGRLDEAGLREAARRIGDAGVGHVAIAGVFSHLNPDHERRAFEIIRDAAPALDITLSSEIGRAGLLERENAAVMNASLKPLAGQVVDGFQGALKRSGLKAPLFISQNDGALMDAARVRAYPVLTFAAGPTNSLRGSSWLSGVKAAMVADIGGTTTDLGVLVNGFPRQSALHVDIGGVRTNFRMPDLLSIGLGGGSLVEQGRVGPLSVGRRLLQDALVFGGETLTASDVAVALGRAAFGDPKRVAGLDPIRLRAADDEIHRLVEDAVDRMKTSVDPVPLILVGGGAPLIGRPLAGVGEVIRPPHAEVANAVGAAIGQIGADIDRIVHGAGLDREALLEQVREEARAEARAQGARPDSVEIVELDSLPLAYMAGGAVRVVCRAVGDLSLPEEIAA